MKLNIPPQHIRIFREGDQEIKVISIQRLAAFNRKVFGTARHGAYDFKSIGICRIGAAPGKRKQWVNVEGVREAFSKLPEDFIMPKLCDYGKNGNKKPGRQKRITENGTSAILSELIEIKDLLKRIAAAWEV